MCCRVLCDLGGAIVMRRSGWWTDSDVELSVVNAEAQSSPDGSTAVTPLEVKVSLAREGVYTI